MLELDKIKKYEKEYRAKKENKEPKEISDYYHNEFKQK